MAWRRSPRPQHAAGQQHEQPPVLVATVDALPVPYEILGLVDASMAVTSGIVPTAQLMDRLADRAAAMGANAVIGVRLSQLTLPGASRARMFGRVTDHIASTVVATAIGTAARTLPGTHCASTRRG